MSQFLARGLPLQDVINRYDNRLLCTTDMIWATLVLEVLKMPIFIYFCNQT